MRLSDLQSRVNLPDIIAAECGPDAVRGLSRDRGGAICDPRPGHEERHPSFSVYRYGGHWRWKRHGGDEASGDALGFLLALGMSMGQALEELARYAGVSLDPWQPQRVPPAPRGPDPLGEARAVLDRLSPLSLAEMDRATRLLAFAGRQTAAGHDLRRRGLYGWQGLQVGILRRDFSTREGRMLAHAGALAFFLNGPDGQPWGLKVRNLGTAEDLQRAGLSRYVYRIGRHGAPAWCSPGYGQGERVLIVEGELNGAAAGLALEGRGTDVQGLAGAGGVPFLEGLKGKVVYLYADPDAAGAACLDRVGRLTQAAGAREVRVMTGAGADFCDLLPTLGRARYVTFLGAREGMGKTTLVTALAWQMTRPDGRGRFLGQPVAAGPVLYLNTDAADGESRPVRYWLEQHRQTFPDGDMSGITVLESTGAGLTPDDLGELLNMARVRGARLVIVDSFMGTFPQLDGNKLEQVMRPMMALRDFAAQTGAAVIVTDHLPKRSAAEQEGDRGIMGSTGKSAQARAVHLLTRVPPREVEGREVLRWEVRKNSFAQSGHAFGIEVERLEDEGGRAAGVHLNPCELPAEEEGRDTRGDRARAAVIAALTAKTGQTVPHAELIAAAIAGGNVKERSAQQAVREALGALGEQVKEVRLSGRGAPRAYRYAPQVPEQEEGVLVIEETPELLTPPPAEEEVLTW
ncbi:hypothetical protein RDMS_09040 [Deinococcus sp. RL]|uniref:AAA family ATPase n=1 Tax=Deinococcus sp. RL TaxID=1489678 RepID=UPI0004D9EFF5|nr:AAA family ATPase [Deinococcus sp. RL]KEF34103.1 hypothetical protein RDMS_09040 [Deinococcus sp. RL]